MPRLANPRTVTLEYVDAHGIETRRLVDIYRTETNERNTIITGWCHGRQAERSFRADRLRSVITENGEVISAGEFLAQLMPERASHVDMLPVADPDDSTGIGFRISIEPDCAPLTTAPQPGQRPARANTPTSTFWATIGNILFVVALLPAGIGALGFAVFDRSATGAIMTLAVVGGPVVAIRAIIRRAAQQNKRE